jgi:hypothetical protein
MSTHKDGVVAVIGEQLQQEIDKDNESRSLGKIKEGIMRHR